MLHDLTGTAFGVAGLQRRINEWLSQCPACLFPSGHSSGMLACVTRRKYLEDTYCRRVDEPGCHALERVRVGTGWEYVLRAFSGQLGS